MRAPAAVACDAEARAARVRGEHGGWYNARGVQAATLLSRNAYPVLALFRPQYGCKRAYQLANHVVAGFAQAPGAQARMAKGAGNACGSGLSNGPGNGCDAGWHGDGNCAQPGFLHCRPAGNVAAAFPFASSPPASPEPSPPSTPSSPPLLGIVTAYGTEPELDKACDKPFPPSTVYLKLGDVPLARKMIVSDLGSI
eukprot:6195648-Pleurochrysis_carterae.AAC.3